MNMKMANDFLLMFSFDKIDKDGNGTIDLDEFVGALLPGVAKQVGTRNLSGTLFSACFLAARASDAHATYCPLQVFEEFDKKGTGELSIDQLPSMLSHLSMKKGKKLDGVKADLQLGDTMVINDFIRVAATMHARGLEPEPEKKKKEKDEKV